MGIFHKREQDFGSGWGTARGIQILKLKSQIIKKNSRKNWEIFIGKQALFEIEKTQ